MSIFIVKAPRGGCLLVVLGVWSTCGENGCVLHWSGRVLGTGGCFLAVITVLMAKEVSILADAWQSLMLFVFGVDQN